MSPSFNIINHPQTAAAYRADQQPDHHTPVVDLVKLAKGVLLNSYTPAKCGLLRNSSAMSRSTCKRSKGSNNEQECGAFLA
jgi:hypothetical protein